MSEEAPPNPIPSIQDFNTSYFFDKTGSLDYNTAAKYFLKLSGGTVGYINTSTYLYNGSIVDFSTITGITNGLCSADKALVVDSNKNILDINNISFLTQSYGNNSTFGATTAYVQNELTPIVNALDTPMGFENRTDSIISYNATTRIFTITPIGSYNIWCKGKRYTISTVQSTTAHETTKGVIYYIWFDSMANLIISTSTPDLLEVCMIAAIYYYDATHTIFMEERHGTIMDPSVHQELHRTIGTYYVSGLSLSGYVLQPSSPVDTDNLIVSASGIIADEDLQLSISSNSGPYAITYLDANGYMTFVNKTLPFQNGTYIQYNQFTGGAWQWTDLNTNQYVNYYYVYTNSAMATLKILVVAGQSSYSSLALAQGETFNSLVLTGLVIPEYLPLYQITFRTSAAYGTVGKCRIESITRISSTRATISSSSIISHQALSDLQLAASGSTYGHINDTSQTIAGLKTFSNGISTNSIALNGSFDLGSNVNTTMNNNLIITGSASSPSTTNGLGFAFSPLISTGRIKAYNYVMSSFNNIDINEGSIYVKNDKKVAIGHTSPSYQLDVSGDLKISGTLYVGNRMNFAGLTGDSGSDMTVIAERLYSGTEITEMILFKGNDTVATSGPDRIRMRAAAFTFQTYTSSETYATLGDNNDRLTISNTGVIGMGTTTVGSNRLEINGIANASGGYRANGIDTINNSAQFVGSGGVNTSGSITASGDIRSTNGRLRCDAALGLQVFNKDDNLTEMRIYCSGYNAYVGPQGDSALRLITNNTTRMYIGADSSNNGNICFHGTSTTFPVSILKGNGESTQSYHYWNSSGNNGSGSSTGQTVSLYTSGRVMCNGEIDVVSDRRVKRDIQLVSNEYADAVITKINPKSFIYKQEGCISYGYIAQDFIKEGFEDFITVNKDETMKEEIDEDGYVNPEGYRFGITTGHMIPILHKKIKMMDDEIYHLKTIIGDALRLNKKLMKKIDMLDI